MLSHCCHQEILCFCWMWWWTVSSSINKQHGKGSCWNKEASTALILQENLYKEGTIFDSNKRKNTLKRKRKRQGEDIRAWKQWDKCQVETKDNSTGVSKNWEEKLLTCKQGHGRLSFGEDNALETARLNEGKIESAMASTAQNVTQKVLV